MEVNKVDLANGETLIDLTSDTVDPSTLVKGVTAHNSKGERIVGNLNPEGGGSGGGIIDVTELPTSSIDENAVYRVTENIQLEKTEIYLRIGEKVTLQQFLALQGIPTIPNIYVVDELPSDMKASDAQTFSELHFYILKSDGIAYAYAPAYGGVITGGLLGFQAMGYDKGFTENINAETENGVYTTIEAYKQVERYFIRENGEWKEITAYVNSVTPHGFTDTDVLSGKYSEEEIVVTQNGSTVDVKDLILNDRVIPTVKVETPFISALINGNAYGVPFSKEWFRTYDGSWATHIRQFAFYNVANLEDVIIPDFIEEIGDSAFGGNMDIDSITFEAKPKTIDNAAFKNPQIYIINVPWAEGEVANAPWGATNATINYNYTGGLSYGNQRVILL